MKGQPPATYRAKINGSRVEWNLVTTRGHVLELQMNGISTFLIISMPMATDSTLTLRREEYEKEGREGKEINKEMRKVKTLKQKGK
jgi:coproporphyrinogen III oxidase